MKTCTKCKIEKPETEFGNHGGKRDGLRSKCKACANTDAAKWNAANPEKRKAITAKSRADPANCAKKNASDAKYRADNQEKIKAAQDRWDAENPGGRNATKSAWDKAHPEVRRIITQNRRARKMENGGKLSRGLADKLITLQRGKCACGCKQPLGDNYHLDHRMPIALGGANEDSNIQLLRATCNLQKSAKHPVDFMQQRGFLI